MFPFYSLFSIFKPQLIQVFVYPRNTKRLNIQFFKILWRFKASVLDVSTAKNNGNDNLS